MGVGREPLAIHLLAEVVELLLREPSLEKSAGVDAGCRVALKEDQVPLPFLVGGAEEVVETHVEEGGGGSEAGDVSTQLRGLAVGLHHHGHGVPADEGANAPLHGPVARERRLLARRNGVEVGGGGLEGEVGAGEAGLLDELFEQVMGPFRTLVLQHRFQRLQPLLGFLGIDIGTFSHDAHSLMMRG